MKLVPRLNLTCGHCGRPYQRTEAELRSKPSRFCSTVCLDAGRRVGRQATCERCGAPFYRKASETARWCSVACYRADRAAHATSYTKIGQRHAHRVNAERLLGRPLQPGEIVHHLDENKRNPAPDNLEVLPSQRVHATLHSTGRRQSADTVRKRVEGTRRTRSGQARASRA
jgi:endogenous inhibitor of DNA gyrase (YacG/DUF329 family)